MTDRMTFDEKKLKIVKRIYDHAYGLASGDPKFRLELLVKALSLCCHDTDNPVFAYNDVHWMLDEYEEISNRMNKKDDTA